MIDSFDTESELVVVTEYAEKELHSILAKEGCLNEDQVKKITWDLVSALYYLHSHRVLHRLVCCSTIYNSMQSIELIYGAVIVSYPCTELSGLDFDD